MILKPHTGAKKRGPLGMLLHVFDCGVEKVTSGYAAFLRPIVTHGEDGFHLPARAEWEKALTPKTRLVLLCNPNNPTGTAVRRGELEGFLDRVPADCLVVLDEAYREFVRDPDVPDALDVYRDRPNVAVLRTFSKAYGLAALRVGYALSSPAVADILNRVRQPFNVNSLALVAARAALDDVEYVARSRSLNEAGMQQLEDGFRQLGLSWIPSKANFIAVDVAREAGPVYQGLLREGVIVRPVAGYGLPKHLRVSIGLASENSRLLEALAKVLARG